MSDSLERTRESNPNLSGKMSSGASHRTEKAFPPVGLGNTITPGSDGRKMDDDPKPARRAEWLPSTRTLHYRMSQQQNR